MDKGKEARRGGGGGGGGGAAVVSANGGGGALMQRQRIGEVHGGVDSVAAATARLRDRGRKREVENRSKRRMAARRGGSDGDELSDESLSESDDEEDEDDGVQLHVAEATSTPARFVTSVAGTPSQTQLTESGHHRPMAQRNGFSRSPAPSKAGDEVIGAAVPRRARSAAKRRRSSREWLASTVVNRGGGGGGGGGNNSPMQQWVLASSASPSRPSCSAAVAAASSRLSPAPPSLHKKIKLSSGVRTKLPEQQQQLQPPPPSLPTPPKIAKSQSFIRPEEMEVAEVLFGFMKQFPANPESERVAGATGDVKLEAATAKMAIVPKRKRPRLVSNDDEMGSVSPARPEPEQDPSTEVPPESLDADDSKKAGGAVTGDPTPVVPDVDSRDSASAMPVLAAEATPTGSSLGETKTEQSSSHGVREGKICIDLMAPPSDKLSPDADDIFDSVAADHKAPAEVEVLPKAERAEEKTSCLMGGFGLEDQKPSSSTAVEVGRSSELKVSSSPVIEEGETTAKQSLKLELNVATKDELLVPSTSETKLDQGAASTMPLLGSWSAKFPPFSYTGQVPAATLFPVDGKVEPSTSMQPAALPLRPNRCITHLYIAQRIHYNQRLAKFGSFLPPMAAAGVAPFFGLHPFNLASVPPADASSSQESKVLPSAGVPPTGNLTKEKAVSVSSSITETSQKKQSTQSTAHSDSATNVIHGPAFLFPMSQQQVAEAAVAASSLRSGEAKSAYTAMNVPLPPHNAPGPSVSNYGAPMSLSFAGLPPTEPQFLAIMQNGYQIPLAAQGAGATSIHGAPPGQFAPYFGSAVLPSHVLQHQQNQDPQQNLRKAGTANGSATENVQKTRGILQLGPVSNTGMADASHNIFPSDSRWPSLSQRPDGDKGFHDRPSTSGRPSHQSSVVPNHLQNMPLMPGNASSMVLGEAAGHTEKKQSAHHQQLQSTAEQPFLVPFASFSGAVTAPGGMNTSTMTPSHLFFQHEAARHGYPQFAIEAMPSVHPSQHKLAMQQSNMDRKSLPVDPTSTPSSSEGEKRKVSSKLPGGEQPFTVLTDRKMFVSNVPGSNISEHPSLALNLIQDPVAVAKSASFAASASHSSGQGLPILPPHHHHLQQQQHQQHQQQIIQLQKQQQQLLTNSQVKFATPSSGAIGHADLHSSASNLTSGIPPGLVSFPQAYIQSGGVPAPFNQWKIANGKPAGAPSGNSDFFRQQGKAMPALSAPSHQTEISFGVSTSKPMSNVPATSGGSVDIPRSTGATIASGLPSSLVSKSNTGGSHSGGSGASNPSSATIAASQSQHPSIKNLPSINSTKTSPVNHYNMAAIQGQPNISPALNSKNKLLYPAQMKQQQQHPTHLLFANAAYVQHSQPHTNVSVANTSSGYYQKHQPDVPQLSQHKNPASVASAANPSDPAKAPSAAGGNMKVLQPPPGLFHAAHLATSQGLPAVAHQRLPTSFSLVSMGPAVSVKPATDPKSAAGN